MVWDTFANPEDVKAWADRAAREDYEKHKVIHTDERTGQLWQVDMNPYSTPGARADWQRGFDGVPVDSFDPPIGPYCTYYQRGAAMARLLKNEVDHA